MKYSNYLDPLYVIFEKYLYDFDSSRLDEFIENIVNEYVAYLEIQKVIIPPQRKSSLLQDLADEVYDMYVKRIHGCLSLKDYQYSGRVTNLGKRLARDRYYKLTGTES